LGIPLASSDRVRPLVGERSLELNRSIEIHGGRPRVLVISADSLYARLLQELLQRTGMQAQRWEATGVDPQSTTDLAEIDVLLVEIHAPGDRESSLVDLVRERSPMVEIVVISSDPDVEDAIQALRRGVFAVLTYPVDDDHLVGAITDAFARKRRGEERIQVLS
jgi:two-component system, NtrC family, response regulator GlrR